MLKFPDSPSLCPPLLHLPTARTNKEIQPAFKALLPWKAEQEADFYHKINLQKVEKLPFLPFWPASAVYKVAQFEKEANLVYKRIMD